MSFRIIRTCGAALLALWLAIVVYAVLVGISGLITLHHYHFHPWDQIRGNTLYIWTPWLVLAPLVFLGATRVPVLPDNWLWPLLKHLAILAVLAFLHGYLSALLYYFIGDIADDMRDYEAWQHTGHFLFVDNLFFVDAFIYTALVASQNINRYYRMARQQELDTVRLQGQLYEARLQALLMQINPHFLFNTLNSISVLIMKKENEKASAMINRLSSFFRQTLEQSDKQLVPLKQELNLIEQYLAIEAIRFGDRLRIDYAVDPNCLGEAVPVLILQPLVENAIKHGIAAKPGPCRLQIGVKQDDNTLMLSVQDDGAGMADGAAATSGVGLRNVQNRLHTLYNNAHQFTFTSTAGVGTTVNIVLPLRSKPVAV